ncbi:MAG: TolC family protein [Planctomycetes bacterium]|nr:TolC family protein [Planctomycetota bacterium]
MQHLLDCAESSHPTHAAIAAARAAATAQLQAAGAWANPEFNLSMGRTSPRVSDLERDLPYGGSLSQRLTWWGARQDRIEAGHARLGVAEAEGRVALLTLRAEVRRAAIAYATALEAAEQAAEEAAIASELAATTGKRLAAGEVDRSLAARVRLEAATATLQRDARRREAATALSVLRTWCDPRLPEGLVIADALTIPACDPQTVAEAASQHPQLQAIAQAMAAAESTIAAERQARIPDLTIGVFADREAEKDTYGMTVGVEIPLWDRNQAGIAQAEAEHAQARAAMRSEEQRLRRDLAEALGAIQTAQGEARALADDAIPVAEETIRLRTAAFASGDASLADLLESRRAVHQIRTELRDARRRAALAAVDLSVVIGDPAFGLAAASRP